jgi:5'-phosphate synthase pdxT subunit
MKKVGVLSLQGDFEAHGAALTRAGAEPVYVREPAQFDSLDGLVIPGGESTTMLKLMGYEPGLRDALQEFAGRKPVFGTCAGAILMANEVTNPAQPSFHLMDMDVERNAYGRQIDSRVAEIDTGPPSSAAWGRPPTCWSGTAATRCWWNRADIWRPHSIPN